MPGIDTKHTQLIFAHLMRWSLLRTVMDLYCIWLFNQSCGIKEMVSRVCIVSLSC